MQLRWPYTTSKPISSEYLQVYPTTFHQAYGIGYSHKLTPQSTSFDNLMPPLMCQHRGISVAHLTTTKWRSSWCDVMHRYMKKPTNRAHAGHFIWWTDGISSHHPNTIVHILARSNTPRVTAIQHRANPTQTHNQSLHHTQRQSDTRFGWLRQSYPRHDRQRQTLSGHEGPTSNSWCNTGTQLRLNLTNLNTGNRHPFGAMSSKGANDSKHAHTPHWR